MPWQTSYWLGAEKWFPIYWPPYKWQIVQLPNIGLAPIPEGFPAPWWLYPKNEWPFEEVPWEPKVFGAFSARKVTMWIKDPNYSDLKNYPPFGTMKIPTAGIHHPHSIGTIKVHMKPDNWLDITPHPSLWAKGQLENALRVMSRTRPIRLQTEDGTITIKSMRHANWHQYKKPSPPPQPTHDLFQ